MDDETVNINYEVTRIKQDVVIVDEMSMVDTAVMNYLVKGLKETTRLVLIGDADQLPSVGAGSILKDLIESSIIPTMNLTEIYRQAKESNIIVNAHKINDGENISLDEKEGDFIFIKETNSMEQMVDIILNKLPKMRKI